MTTKKVKSPAGKHNRKSRAPSGGSAAASGPGPSAICGGPLAARPSALMDSTNTSTTSLRLHAGHRRVPPHARMLAARNHSNADGKAIVAG